MPAMALPSPSHLRAEARARPSSPRLVPLALRMALTATACWCAPADEPLEVFFTAAGDEVVVVLEPPSGHMTNATAASAATTSAVTAMMSDRLASLRFG